MAFLFFGSDSEDKKEYRNGTSVSNMLTTRMCQDSAGEGRNVERVLDVHALRLFLPHGNLLKGYHTAWDIMVTG
jgi:hypothetical protein